MHNSRLQAGLLRATANTDATQEHEDCRNNHKIHAGTHFHRHQPYDFLSTTFKIWTVLTGSVISLLCGIIRPKMRTTAAGRHALGMRNIGDQSAAGIGSVTEHSHTCSTTWDRKS